MRLLLWRFCSERSADDCVREGQSTAWGLGQLMSWEA